MPINGLHHHHHNQTTKGERAAAVRRHHAGLWKRQILPRIQRWLSIFFHKLAWVPFVVVLLTMVLMPLAYDGGERWWLPIFNTILIAMYGVWMLSAWWCGGDSAKTRWHGTLLLLMLPIAAGLLQLIPCASLVRILNPHTWQLWSDFSGLGIGTAVPRLSLSVDSTIQRLSLLIACLLLLFILLSKAHHRLHLKLILAAVGLAALCNAILAFVLFFCSSGVGIEQLSPFTGTFLNRNHFGFFMMLGTMSFSGLMAAIISEKRHEDGDWEHWPLLTVPISLAIFTLVTALVLSLSRGAFIGATVSMLLFGITWLARGGDGHRDRRHKTMALVVLVAGALVLALPHTMRKLSERYESLFANDLSLDSRWTVWNYSTALIRDNWAAGVGLGAFPDSIQPYEQGTFTDALIDHAHNDFLEFAAETGLPFAAFILLLGAALWFRSLYRVWHQHDRTYRWAGMAALLAILGAALHEFVEFNLLAWPNALLFTALVAVASICGRNRMKPADEATHKLDASELHLIHKRGRWRWRLALLPATLAIFTILIPYQCRKIKGAVADANLRAELEPDALAWKPGRVDFQRRHALAETANRSFKNDHDILLRCAVTDAEYASNRPADALVYWREACQLATTACTRAPGDGLSALLCAKLYENATLAHATNYDDNTVIALYQWAVRCQPTICETVRDAAYAMHRFFVKSRTVAPELTETRRKAALEMLSKMLAVNPNLTRDVCNILFDLVEDDPKRLITNAPDNYPARRVLLDFLIENNCLPDAMKLMELMKPDLQRPLEPFETNKDRRLDVLDWHAVNLAILEIQDEQPRRDAGWPALEQAAAELSALNLQKATELFENAKAEQARLTAHAFAGKYPQNPDIIILDARISAFLGRYDEALHALMPLTFIENKTISDKQLNQARLCIGGGAGDWRASSKSRATFLKNAIDILRAEADGPSNGLAANVKELTQLELNMHNDTSMQWLQMHLVPYFIGRAHIIRNEPTKAADAFRRALDICPNNLFVLQRLAKLSPNALTDDEQTLLDKLDSRRHPVAIFPQGLCWLATYNTTPVLPEVFSEAETEFLFCAYDDINEDATITVTYADDYGPLYSDTINFAESAHPMVSWRVGEVFSVTFKCQPHVKTLHAHNRLIQNGTVKTTMTAVSHGKVLSNIPLAKSLAFSINRQEKLKPSPGAAPADGTASPR